VNTIIQPTRCHDKKLVDSWTLSLGLSYTEEIVMNTPTISVIIPALNEVRTICSVIEIVRTWEKTLEIIVVNDEATTDDTLAALKRYKGMITILINKKNKGKGDALATGIAKATGDILLFIDADLMSLTHFDLDKLVSPLLTGKAAMATAILKYWKAGSFEPFSEISGTRALYRNIVSSHLKSIKTSGYGVELLFNELHKRKKIVYVRLPHVYVVNKFEKQNIPDALLVYIKEAKELVTEMLRQQRDAISPQAVRVFRGVQNYLKKSLEYITTIDMS